VRRPIAALALSALALTTPSLPAMAQQEPEKVLASASSGLNLASVQAKVAQGDAAAAAGKLSEAKSDYDKALEAASYLVSAYRGLSGAFRGLDARIPREMDQKGREATELQANIELRLAALLRRMNQPQVAVPLLVRVVQRMSPTSPQGQKAYQSLLELGFVATPYTAVSATPAAQ
jgi:tetratricopeptide (TPR) repeat protein